MSRPILSLADVGVTYGGGIFSRTTVEAVRGVSFDISAGETLGLVGESGSGKTTLGQVCLGLLAPTRGDVFFGGSPFPTLRTLRGRLSVVLQHPEWALNPRLTCGTSVAEPLVILGQKEGNSEKVSAILDKVGLDPALASRYPGELSGGQRQRMAIARALITEPQFVVFDEAVSALDVSVQAQVLNLIRDLQSKHSFGALFISHDLAATRYACHRIAVMRRGEVLEIGPAQRFYDQAEHPYSRALMATIS